MPTTERERYRAAVALLEEARRQLRRSEIMVQVALNRVRNAEEEGFDDEATRRETRRAELADAVERERSAMRTLADRAEAARHLAVGEEIDELAGDYDAALVDVLAQIEHVAAAAAVATELAERAMTLAATLPTEATGPRRVAEAVAQQVRAVNRALEQLATAVTETDLPRRPPTPSA